MKKNKSLLQLLTKIITKSGSLDYEKIVQFWTHITEISTWRRITGEPRGLVEDLAREWAQQTVTCNICAKECQTQILLEQLQENTEILKSDLRRWKFKAFESIQAQRRDERAMDDLTTVLTTVKNLVQGVHSVNAWPPRDSA